MAVTVQEADKVGEATNNCTQNADSSNSLLLCGGRGFSVPLPRMWILVRHVIHSYVQIGVSLTSRRTGGDVRVLAASRAKYNYPQLYVLFLSLVSRWIARTRSFYYAVHCSTVQWLIVPSPTPAALDLRKVKRSPNFFRVINELPQHIHCQCRFSDTKVVE